MGALDKKHKKWDGANSLDADGISVVGELVGAEQLVNVIKKERKKGKVNKMCKAINDLIEDGKRAEKARADAAERELEKLLNKSS